MSSQIDTVQINQAQSPQVPVDDDAVYQHSDNVMSPDSSSSSVVAPLVPSSSSGAEPQLTMTPPQPLSSPLTKQTRAQHRQSLPKDSDIWRGWKQEYEQLEGKQRELFGHEHIGSSINEHRDVERNEEKTHDQPSFQSSTFITTAPTPSSSSTSSSSTLPPPTIVSSTTGPLSSSSSSAYEEKQPAAQNQGNQAKATGGTNNTNQNGLKSKQSKKSSQVFNYGDVSRKSLSPSRSMLPALVKAASISPSTTTLERQQHAVAASIERRRSVVRAEAEKMRASSLQRRSSMPISLSSKSYTHLQPLNHTPNIITLSPSHAQQEAMHQHDLSQSAHHPILQPLRVHPDLVDSSVAVVDVDAAPPALSQAETMLIDHLQQQLLIKQQQLQRQQTLAMQQGIVLPSLPPPPLSTTNSTLSPQSIPSPANHHTHTLSHPNLLTQPTQLSTLHRSSSSPAINPSIPSPSEPMQQLHHLLAYYGVPPQTIAQMAPHINPSMYLPQPSALPAVSERVPLRINGGQQPRRQIGWNDGVDMGAPESRSYSADVVVNHKRHNHAMMKHLDRLAARKQAEAEKLEREKAEEEAERLRRQLFFEKRLAAQRRAKAKAAAAAGAAPTIPQPIIPSPVHANIYASPVDAPPVPPNITSSLHSLPTAAQVHPHILNNSSQTLQALIPEHLQKQFQKMQKNERRSKDKRKSRHSKHKSRSESSLFSERSSSDYSSDFTSYSDSSRASSPRDKQRQRTRSMKHSQSESSLKAAPTPSHLAPPVGGVRHKVDVSPSRYMRATKFAKRVGFMAYQSDFDFRQNKEQPKPVAPPARKAPSKRSHSQHPRSRSRPRSHSRSKRSHSHSHSSKRSPRSHSKSRSKSAHSSQSDYEDDFESDQSDSHSRNKKVKQLHESTFKSDDNDRHHRSESDLHSHKSRSHKHHHHGSSSSDEGSSRRRRRRVRDPAALLTADVDWDRGDAARALKEAQQYLLAKLKAKEHAERHERRERRQQEIVKRGLSSTDDLPPSLRDTPENTHRIPSNPHSPPFSPTFSSPASSPTQSPGPSPVASSRHSLRMRSRSTPPRGRVRVAHRAASLPRDGSAHYHQRHLVEPDQPVVVRRPMVPPSDRLMKTTASITAKKSSKIQVLVDPSNKKKKKKVTTPLSVSISPPPQSNSTTNLSPSESRDEAICRLSAATFELEQRALKQQDIIIKLLEQVGKDKGIAINQVDQSASNKQSQSQSSSVPSTVASSTESSPTLSSNKASGKQPAKRTPSKSPAKTPPDSRRQKDKELKEKQELEQRRVAQQAEARQKEEREKAEREKAEREKAEHEKAEREREAREKEAREREAKEKERVEQESKLRAAREKDARDQVKSRAAKQLNTPSPPKSNIKSTQRTASKSPVKSSSKATSKAPSNNPSQAGSTRTSAKPSPASSLPSSSSPSPTLKPAASPSPPPALPPSGSLISKSSPSLTVASSPMKPRSGLWRPPKAPLQREKSQVQAPKLWDNHATNLTVSQAMKQVMNEDERAHFLESHGLHVEENVVLSPSRAPSSKRPHRFTPPVDGTLTNLTSPSRAKSSRKSNEHSTPSSKRHSEETPSPSTLKAIQNSQIPIAQQLSDKYSSSASSPHGQQGSKIPRSQEPFSNLSISVASPVHQSIINPADNTLVSPTGSMEYEDDFE